nr:MAG TPA: hypothetical protein [Caudoviricetes sp.]
MVLFVQFSRYYTTFSTLKISDIFLCCSLLLCLVYHIFLGLSRVF